VTKLQSDLHWTTVFIWPAPFGLDAGPGGHASWTRLEPIRNYRARENFLHALPWGWIASGQGKETCCLQLCVTRDLPRLLCPLPALRHKKIYEQVTLTFCAERTRRLTWVRKTRTMLLICLVSRRYLDEFEYKVFRFHFLLAPTGNYAAANEIDRGTFFHAVYRIQQKLVGI